jgi:hypothetical protein
MKFIEFFITICLITLSAYMLHIDQYALSLWFFGVFLWWTTKEI